MLKTNILNVKNINYFCNKIYTMTRIKNDAPGMKGPRGRNQDGPLRQKRSDTFISTIEKTYNIDLGVRGDKHLGTHLKDTNSKSLSELIDKTKR